MVILDLSAASTAALDSFLLGIDRTSPQHTAYAISRRMRQFDYGCDENVKKGIYRRFPHEIDRLATCEDMGTFAYFAAQRAGLDVALAIYHDFRGTNQTHFEPVLRTSTDNFSFTHNNFERYDAVAAKADFVEFVDNASTISSIVNTRHDPKLFFQTGQLFKSLTFLGTTINGFCLPVYMTRSVLNSDSGFFLRKVYDLPGIYIVMERKNGELKVSAARDVDSTKVEGNLDIFRYAIESDKVSGVAQFIMPPTEKEKLLRRLWTIDSVCQWSAYITPEEQKNLMERQKYEQTDADVDLILGASQYIARTVRSVSKFNPLKLSPRDTERLIPKVPEIVDTLWADGLIPAEADFIHNAAQLELVMEVEKKLGM